MQPSQPISVFIADDHPVVRGGIIAILVNSGFQLVGESSSGIDLLRHVIESKSNVLILDLNMPNFEDPGGFVQKLVQAQPQIRILVLTSYSDPDLSASLINNGARGFLLKDTMADTLTAAISHISEGGLFIAPQVAEAIQKHNRLSEGLTQREKEILALIADGISTAEISTMLSIAPDTVRKHLKAIYAKLGVSSRNDIRELVRKSQNP
jgi:DNA-binding NarL/FixJ family response regulator